MDSLLSIESLVKELDEPNSASGWKLLAQTSSLSVYRQTDKDKKIFGYKCYSHIPDITPEISYKVSIDMEYKLVWDKYLKEAEPINDEEKSGVYLRTSTPIIRDNRDFTLTRDYGEYDIGNRHFYYVMTRSEQFKNIPPRKKVVRVENCQSQTLICSDGAKGHKSIFIYYEISHKRVPKAVWIWLAKFGVPLFAKLTHNACLAYPEWIKDKNIKLPDVNVDEFDTATAAATGISTDDLEEQEDD